MSSTGTSAATSHLSLADGLIETAKISRDCSEYDMRNAYSRSYYALFHVCHGYLRAAGVDIKSPVQKHSTHGALHAEMGRQMGRWFGWLIKGAWELRCRSDYDPEWPVPLHYSCVKQLEEARSQYHSVRRNFPGHSRRSRQG